MLGVGLFLECGQVEQEWSFFRLFLALYFCDGGCAFFSYFII